MTLLVAMRTSSQFETIWSNIIATTATTATLLLLTLTITPASSISEGKSTTSKCKQRISWSFSIGSAF